MNRWEQEVSSVELGWYGGNFGIRYLTCSMSILQRLVLQPQAKV